MTHLCVSKTYNIASDNGLSPKRHQAIILNNVAILSIRPKRTYFSEVLFKLRKFSLKKKDLKMPSAKWRQFCIGLNVLTNLYCMRCCAVCSVKYSVGFLWNANVLQYTGNMQCNTVTYKTLKYMAFFIKHEYIYAFSFYSFLHTAMV